ncbi:hypothetical protein NL676_018163 [Syzygium grande]|nr:hypothetical protein NL676_018163 [Syzygium grande]
MLKKKKKKKKTAEMGGGGGGGGERAEAGGRFCAFGLRGRREAVGLCDEERDRGLSGKRFISHHIVHQLLY